MGGNKNRKSSPSPKPNLASHQARCTVCAHPQREEIEEEYISWKSPARIATDFKLRDRSAVYRHARALDLGKQRDRNIRAALARMIEKADDVRVTAGAAVQAIALYARINARGELVERDDRVGIHDLFAKMSHDELEAYAKDGSLPSWFSQLKNTKDPQGSGGDENV